MTDTRTCRECGETQPLKCFAENTSHYRAADGTVKIYRNRRWACNQCRAKPSGSVRKMKRSVNDLLRWAPPRVRS